MRFEVKGGGIAAILFAMTLLSGAVFVLGLLAGYDVGRQAQIDAAQLATSYPLQSPPASVASNSQSAPKNGVPEGNNPTVQAASSSHPPATGETIPVSAGAGSALAADSNASGRAPSKPRMSPPAQRLASAGAASPIKPASTTESADGDMNAAGSKQSAGDLDQSTDATANPPAQVRRRVASKTAPARRRPYNIQIQAAMDISGADKMMERLQKLGYTTHLVPTEIAGQRWYKVEVGPYATAEEASDAEAELREKYDQTYGGVARGSSAAKAGTNDDSEE
ncbi:MAG TPA: SPOR domain-containing protein [Candidatus Binataceae bacterium]|nr:SPOR domain-containing protein [Candidatus Binataceae bacterium]